MLLILMYHRAGEGYYSNPVSVLREHFRFLRERYPVVLPGEPLTPRRLNLCLTFDDARADFYAQVFPLLQELSLKAVLGVPTAFIIENTPLSLPERITVADEHATQGDIFRTKAPFCTWTELRTMADSGLVEAASHSHGHVDMSHPTSDPSAEALRSKTLLEQQLGRRVSTFVYPFGGVNARAHQAVTQHFAYTMRIGRALNASWAPPRQPLCRVSADRVADVRRLLSWGRLATYAFKWVTNVLRAASGKWQTRER
jgi:peptidoglycan/xylan/chitin deacetylase (PgdA/CDA1 family)